MSEGFDAAAAAARAVGDDPDTGDPSEGSPTVTDGDTESTDVNGDAPSPDGSEPSTSPVDQLRKRLLSTEPQIPLDSDELSVHDVENGGIARVKRGFYKALGVDGATALEDIALGTFEEFAGDTHGGTSEAGDESGASGDTGPLAGGGV